MSASGQDAGPGQETAPGLVLPGDPLRRLHYRLTPADALAWEALPAEARGWSKLALFAPWVAAGLGWGITDGAELDLALRLAMVTGAALAVWVLTQALLARGRLLRARARIAAPVEMVCAVWGDRLAAFAVAAPDARTVITPDRIRQVVTTGARLFLDCPDCLLILPLQAFDDAADMARFAARWDGLSRRAQP